MVRLDEIRHNFKRVFRDLNWQMQVTVLHQSRNRKKDKPKKQDRANLEEGDQEHETLTQIPHLNTHSEPQVVFLKEANGCRSC